MRIWLLVASALLAGLASYAVAASTADRTRLPLGDGRYRTSAEKGYVFSCQTRFSGGGAQADGPWIDAAGGTWDLTRKIAVAGSVGWPGHFGRRLTRTRNVLSGNGLPTHKTGVFPIRASDPAYRYDRNPNAIAAYALRASLPRSPTRARRPTCVGGTIGVMRNGIALYGAFDAGGRDAPAHEVQDACDGHPERTGQYHYHSLPRCIADSGRKGEHSGLLGWALDGFGIYGLRGQQGKRLSSASLDVCHGHTHRIRWHGRSVVMYHYHATLDFPYMVACYRGAPITAATGLHIGAPAGPLDRLAARSPRWDA